MHLTPLSFIRKFSGTVILQGTKVCGRFLKYSLDRREGLIMGMLFRVCAAAVSTNEYRFVLQQHQYLSLSVSAYLLCPDAARIGRLRLRPQHTGRSAHYPQHHEQVRVGHEMPAR